MAPKIITGYGELMLRLSPLTHGHLLEQTDQLKMGFAGAEANILAGLSMLGHPTSLVSAFPRNPVGRSADFFLKRLGIQTQHIQWDHGRMGTYFIEHGLSIRGTRVTYDRSHSLISQMLIPHSVWEDTISKASLFVLTGITPALSEICQQNIENALSIARKKKVQIAFDLNYRRTLWSADDARKAFERILPKVDILFANIGAASDVFGVSLPATASYEDLLSATERTIPLLNNFGHYTHMALTLRLQQSASQNILGGIIVQGKEKYISQPIPIQIMDRLGGGDAFAAAILHGIIKKWPLQQTIQLATAAFAVTQTLEGDINYSTEQELLALASGSISGFVKR